MGESDNNLAFENFGAENDFNMVYDEFKLSYCPGPGNSVLSI